LCCWASIAKPGDVLIIVSPPKSGTGTRGLETDHRIVLCVFVVTETLAPWIYYGPACPKWARTGRSDRIYTVTVHLRRGIREFLTEADTGGPCRVKTWTQNEESKDAMQNWDVAYNDGPSEIIYTRRPRARWHQEPQEALNSLGEDQRWRDFEGRVLVSRCFLKLPGDANNPLSVNAAAMGLKPGHFGIGFRHAKFSGGTKLRKWFESLF
jgi:hypothetical protein